ncbi:HTH-type transcriptional regulator frlR [Levilactobacillus brevis]|uniref:HTH-type transcriptional regulator frlR n=2 Tax=Levilactobacillus brevis TaxID=1580 RepID=A0A5B7Y386_LEVBR|nr:GntR family transcriptional regulator [Levilactobacillus brevis]QCZ54310.1 HTH-type transcriptional regulator frlR [Levilactobacillus brevis]
MLILELEYSSNRIKGLKEMAIDKHKRNSSIRAQIVADIQASILKNMQTGDKLPSEAAYARQYDVTRSTIQKALKDLEDLQMIDRVQGKGSFVKLTKPKIDMFNFKGFSDYALQLGATPVTRVLKQEIVDHHLILQRLRGIKTSDEVVQLTLDESHLNLEQFPGLEQTDFEQNSLYQTLRSQFKVYPATANLLVTPIMPTVAQAELLEVANSQPLLQVTGQVRTANNDLVETIKIIYSGQSNFKFVVGV